MVGHTDSRGRRSQVTPPGLYSNFVLALAQVKWVVVVVMHRINNCCIAMPSCGKVPLNTWDAAACGTWDGGCHRQRGRKYASHVWRASHGVLCPPRPPPPPITKVTCGSVASFLLPRILRLYTHFFPRRTN